MSEPKRIPQHVAIIMDGNGRWAGLHGKERYEGHAAGVEPVRASLRAAVRWGVKYLTLYAFSTENWGRPAGEVSSRSEIVLAVRRIAARAAAGEIAPGEIGEETLSAALDTAPWPDPDLVVRTSGEQRLSNFLLWQSSYAELWFPEVLWPDFTETDFDRAMEEYARRDRRFGLVK